MPPMDFKEWWIAAVAATSLTVPGAEAATRPGDQAGVVSAVRPGVKSSLSERVLYVGGDVLFGERFATDASGVMHILFMDQSSITLGPNTEITIDKFVYDPDKREGNLAINLLKGALRVVGGFISKKTPTRVSTVTATIGIRGGISLIEAAPQQTQAVFLFGQQMQVTSVNGESETSITRPGFGISVQGNMVGQPFLAPVSMLQNMSRVFGVTPSVSGTSASQSLVSTTDRPSGLVNPNLSLANDRTQNASDNFDAASPQNSFRKLLGTSPAITQS